MGQKLKYFLCLMVMFWPFVAESYEFKNPIFANALYSVNPKGQKLKLENDQITDLNNDFNRCCILLSDRKNSLIYECDCTLQESGGEICKTYYRYLVTGERGKKYTQCLIKRERFEKYADTKLSKKLGEDLFYVYAGNCIPYKPIIPEVEEHQMFNNLWFYETLTMDDNPNIKLKLSPLGISFNGAKAKDCEMMYNLDTRVMYRCEYGDVDTYHLFVSAGKDEKGRCIILADSKILPQQLNVGLKPQVYSFMAEDCGEAEDLTDWFMR